MTSDEDDKELKMSQGGARDQIWCYPSLCISTSMMVMKDCTLHLLIETCG